MLLRFRFANHRSIRDEQELSLLGTEFNEGTARSVGVRAGSRELTALPVVGIFGANASGKSNVIDALATFTGHVTRIWREYGIGFQPFKLDPATAASTSFYEAEFTLGDPPVRFVYGFEATIERVRREWLHAYPVGRRQVWFDRDASRGRDREFEFPGTGLTGRREVIAELTRTNVLYLTAASVMNHAQLAPIQAWFGSILEGMVATKNFRLRAAHVPTELESLTPPLWQVVRTLLAKADLGVTDIDYRPYETAIPTVRLKHGSVALDFEHDESMGTIALLATAARIAKNLDLGRLTLFDEIGASMHPALAAEIIRLFQDPRTNPAGAQLLFTSHDATLLAPTDDGRLLDRDQIWFTEKAPDGTTTLYPLIDSKPRRDENIERRYLRGHYGAVPHISAGRLVRAVAHTMEEQTEEHSP